ncbi:MAG: repressor LexA [Victivallales bacterium]|nr:repressor LexA [Victivallales bacterium]
MENVTVPDDDAQDIWSPPSCWNLPANESGRKGARALTDKQRAVLEYISQFSHHVGMAPTIYEISEHFHIKSATAFAHVRALQRKGYVVRSSKARSLLLTHQEKPRHYSMAMSIPLLGRISAGCTTPSEENEERVIQFDTKCLPANAGEFKLFALQVHGDSMQDLGIFDGDLVVAKQVQEASMGDVVVAMVDGETTIKSLYMTNRQWELRPANPNYKSIFVPLDRLVIQGIVIALQRVYL